MKIYSCKLAVLLFAVAGFISCKKTHIQPKKPVPDLTIHTDHGRIREDFAMCAYCGGYLIRFDNDTSVIYRSHQSLDSFGITPDSKFPIEATISWKRDTFVSLPTLITITSLKTDQ